VIIIGLAQHRRNNVASDYRRSICATLAFLHIKQSNKNERNGMKERDIGSITYSLNMKPKMTTTLFISNGLLAK
jgi:hypothetical protein